MKRIEEAMQPDISLLEEVMQEPIGIVCTVCAAVYVPAPMNTYLLHAAPAVVESAFMSMCHFCFRCRRPACPSCWDETHGICGDCALDTQLPFRLTLAPLPGLLVPPSTHIHTTRMVTLAPPMVCAQPGRFQTAPFPIETASTVYLPSMVASSSLSGPRHKEEPSQDQKGNEKGIIASPNSSDTPDHVSISVQKRTVLVIERILTLVLALILLTILTMIGLALIFVGVNSWISSVFHVDVRLDILILYNLLLELFGLN